MLLPGHLAGAPCAIGLLRIRPTWQVLAWTTLGCLLPDILDKGAKFIGFTAWSRSMGHSILFWICVLAVMGCLSPGKSRQSMALVALGGAVHLMSDLVADGFKGLFETGVLLSAWPLWPLIRGDALHWQPAAVPVLGMEPLQYLPELAVVIGALFWGVRAWQSRALAAFIILSLSIGVVSDAGPPRGLRAAGPSYGACFDDFCETQTGRILVVTPEDNLAKVAWRARPGDTIRLTAGVHRYPDRLVLTGKNGEGCRRIVIEGQEDGSTLITGSFSDRASAYPPELRWTPWLEEETRHLYVSRRPITDYLSDPLAFLDRLDKGGDPRSRSGVRGFVGDQLAGDPHREQLVPYYYWEEFSSENQVYMPSKYPTAYREPLYVGPGLYFDARACHAALQDSTESAINAELGDLSADSSPSDYPCHVFIRLDGGDVRDRDLYSPKSDSAQYRREQYWNPNRRSVYLFAANPMVVKNVDRWTLRNLTIQDKHRVMVSASSGRETSNILLEGLDISGSAGIAVFGHEDRGNIGLVRRVMLRKLSIDLGFPRWIFWSDVKRTWVGHPHSSGGHSALGPAYQLTSAGALLGPAEGQGAGPTCVSLEDSLVENTWFGVSISGGDHLFALNNRVSWAHDDGVLITSRSTADVVVAYNQVFTSFSGITQVPNGLSSIPGSTFIHHNVVDLARGLDNATDRSAPRMAHMRLGGKHSSPYGVNRAHYAAHSAPPRPSPVNVYNNTFIARHDTVEDWRSAVSFVVSEESEIPSLYLHNIVVQQMAGQTVLSQAAAHSGPSGAPVLVTDGNVFFRSTAAEPGLQVHDFLKHYWYAPSGNAAEACLQRGRPRRYLNTQGKCVLPHNRRYNFHTWTEFREGRPTTRPVQHPDSKGRLQPVQIQDIDELFPDVSCRQRRCEVGFEANSVMADPDFRGDYRPVDRAPFRGILRVPEHLPDAHSPFVGACDPGPLPCRVGPARSTVGGW